MKVNPEVVFKPEVPVDRCGVDGYTLQVRAKGLDPLGCFDHDPTADMAFTALGSSAGIADEANPINHVAGESE